MPGPSPAQPTRLRLSDLPRNRVTDIVYAPETADRQQIARDLGIDALRKLRLSVRLSPRGRQDWDLSAEIGATVVQPCVVSLAPVTTRIDDRFERRLSADLPAPLPGETETPLSDDDPLPESLDLRALATEQLALALPDYPRAPGAEAVRLSVAPEGTAPLTDDDVRPFAGLKALRDRLRDDG